MHPPLLVLPESDVVLEGQEVEESVQQRHYHGDPQNKRIGVREQLSQKMEKKETTAKKKNKRKTKIKKKLTFFLSTPTDKLVKTTKGRKKKLKMMVFTNYNKLQQITH